MSKVINIIRRDFKTIEIRNIRDVDNNIFTVADLAGYVAKLTFKSNPENPDSKAEMGPKEGVISEDDENPGQAMLTFSLDSDDSDIVAMNYYFDARVIKIVEDVLEDRQTVCSGQAVVSQDVTHGV
jgi:hypothetical protein